ncbi:hypothetical protein M231_07900 [Tremella mesenterica]|uniref:Uncharacterized protein n=1 Tax=Tremella mesenterica TaxID=5217 RepID=A0A4Q1B800_TREME|nr:hypothetical protein M231_07900 [Tremella mesenterica]
MIRSLSQVKGQRSLAFSAIPLRQLSASAVSRASHHDHHEQHHGHGQEESSDVYTTESFLSPAWRNTFILIAASLVIYPYLPSPAKTPASPSTSPEAFSRTAQDSNAPLVTRLMARITPEAEVWTKRNDKHLELTKEMAEQRLLFQEAERPKIWRMRYPR